VAVLAAIALKAVRGAGRGVEQGRLWRENRGRRAEILGASNPVASRDVVIEAPQIAENGAVVPIEITSNVPGTTSIAVLIDKNPFPLVGKFDFMEGALPFVKLTRSWARPPSAGRRRSARKHYVATQEIKVTIGGCGG